MPIADIANSIEVRQLKATDLAALDDLYANDQLLKAAGLVIDANPEFRQMVFSNWIDRGYLWGVFSHQLLIGTINLFPQEKEIEIGYLLMPKYQHVGIMSAAVGQLLQKFSKRPIFAKVAVTNRPSQGVLQKNGFQLVAKQQGWMRFLKNE